MDAIGSVIDREKPHVIAFQEMTPASVQMIRRQAWFGRYHCSIPDSTPYFTLLLTLFPPIKPRRIPFVSMMARDLLTCIIEVPTSAGLRRLSVATSHLESERRFRHVRLEQLDASLRLLSHARQQTNTALFMGDMNLARDEGLDVVARWGWIDAWLHLLAKSLHHTSAAQSDTSSQDQSAAKATDALSAALLARNSAFPPRGNEKDGATYDTSSNRMLAPRNRGSGYHARFDRMWMRMGKGEERREIVEGKQATLAVAGIMTSQPSSSSSSSSSSESECEWSIVSLERLGLCAIDMRQPHLYAHNKEYKKPEDLSSTNRSATQPTSASPAASDANSAAASNIHGFSSSASASLASSSSSPPIFPSDHYGLLLTLKLKCSATDPSDKAVAAAASSSSGHRLTGDQPPAHGQPPS